MSRRLLLGGVIVLVASAATTAVFVNGQITTLRKALSQNPSLNVGTGLLANAGFGSPQTLLLVGNDQRAHTTTQPVLPHSNEMLLVRIDPSQPWISMMSIPRELWVPIYPPNADEMGCVYSTVDRRYYHVNTPTSEQYQEINLQPGYQKLCGTQALQFVSYRHGDTSLVRDARRTNSEARSRRRCATTRSAPREAALIPPTWPCSRPECLASTTTRKG